MQFPFRRISASRDSSSLGAPVVSGNPQDQPKEVGPSPEGELVQGTVDWVPFDGSSDSIQLMGG